MKEERTQEKNQFCAYKKRFHAVFKNGLNPVLGSIPRLPIKFSIAPYYYFSYI
jgi:hypothetical protein